MARGLDTPGHALRPARLLAVMRSRSALKQTTERGGQQYRLSRAAQCLRRTATYPHFAHHFAHQKWCLAFSALKSDSCKPLKNLSLTGFILEVEPSGFEPLTPCMPCRCFFTQNNCHNWSKEEAFVYLEQFLEQKCRNAESYSCLHRYLIASWLCPARGCLFCHLWNRSGWLQLVLRAMWVAYTQYRWAWTRSSCCGSPGWLYLLRRYGVFRRRTDEGTAPIKRAMWLILSIEWGSAHNWVDAELGEPVSRHSRAI